ncbi:MAG TPA: GTPase HflX [bacterium]|nr:GTPase HflX [bacterium]
MKGGFLIKKLKETEYYKKEKVLLVGVELMGKNARLVEESLEELAFLTSSANAEVTCQTTQRRERIDPACFIGRGKASEIKNLCAEQEINTVIFDDDLSPAQQRNLEEIIKCKVIDRTRLILDIFASRARTQEGKLQVELAQLTYLLPRLTGKGVTLAQQVGGIGVRGPGEKKLEYDRRKVEERISKLQKEINKVSEHREQQRQRRQRVPLSIIAIVGYTNSGKTTLLNTLTSSHVFVEDKLFSTLDPTIRGLILPNKEKVLLVDTVGFIHKLPHQLVAAFRATLEEVTSSDLLLHIVDASHPEFQKQIIAVEKVLQELDALGKPTITIFNKMDLIKNKPLLPRLKRKYKDSINISAKKGLGLDRLYDRIIEHFGKDRNTIELVIPQARSDLVNLVYEKGTVLSRKYNDKDILLQAQLDQKTVQRLKEFIKKKRRRAVHGVRGRRRL